MALERGTPLYMVFMPLYNDIHRSSGTTESKIRGYFSSDKGVNALLGSQLTGYAVYAKYLPGDQPGKPSTKWLTDWKSLPAGHHFDRAQLNGFERVWVTYLKGTKPASATVGLGLPCIKFNGRGEVESLSRGERVLGGVYLSINKGGVLAAKDTNDDLYLRESADAPEAVPANGRRWLHINGVTGRAEIKELTEEEVAAGLNLQKNKFELFIIASPQDPDDFHDSMANYQPIVSLVNDTSVTYNRPWAGPPGSEWYAAPDGKSYPSKTGPNNVLIPAFTNLPNRQTAIRLKWYLEKLVGDNPSFVGKKVMLRIAHQK
tara:strand:- start:39 stop:989 length:951 start_codon:yes stop_codon:yes gene_type:complete